MQPAPRPATVDPPAITRSPTGELPLARELARAVARRQVLQRQDNPAPAGPLSAAQVAKAISYYKQQPTRYTPAIMVQLQEAVGVEQTGRADAATVQGVAVWQRDNGGTPPEQQLEGVIPPPALQVDGMAGPRTLPRIFAHGLNVKSEGLAFGLKAQSGVIDEWRNLTPKKRAEELVRLVNVHLEKAGVPAVAANAEESSTDLGSFDSFNWQMDIGLEALKNEQPSLKQARKLVDTIYHEARHAEQSFRMAQLRAAQLRRKAGPDEDLRLEKVVAKDTEVPRRIAKKAVEAPLAIGSMQALIAQHWYDADIGPGRPDRDRKVEAAQKAVTARLKAQERFDKDPTPANAAALEKAKAHQKATFAAYRELPLENDAWTTGPMTSPGVTRGAPDLPPLPPPGPGNVPAPPAGPSGMLKQLLGAKATA